MDEKKKEEIYQRVIANSELVGVPLDDKTKSIIKQFINGESTFEEAIEKIIKKRE